MNRGEFTIRVKEELAALRPAAPAEHRALLAALLRFAATLHIGGTLGPRYTLILATGSGGVTRLALWLLQTGYGVRPDVRVREAGALARGGRPQRGQLLTHPRGELAPALRGTSSTPAP